MPKGKLWLVAEIEDTESTNNSNLLTVVEVIV